MSQSRAIHQLTKFSLALTESNGQALVPTEDQIDQLLLLKYASEVMPVGASGYIVIFEVAPEEYSTRLVNLCRRKVTEVIDGKPEILVNADALKSIPPSSIALALVSDVHDAINAGDMELARKTLNDLKIVIDARLATKNEQGRHIFPEDT